MELISVIVPVYKVEKYLLRCVNSIRNQTYSNLEIILVDDGSPDGCPQFCDVFAQEDQRIKVIHKKNGGLGFARNSGLDVATGTYVVFVDSDDWISATHIEHLYRAAQEHKADVVVGSYTRAFASGEFAERSHALETRCYTGEEVRSRILLRLLGADQDFPRDVQLEPSCWGNIYRMDLIRTYNLRFISEKVAVSEDIYFSADVYYRATRVALLNEVGYYYYENMSSISKSFDIGIFERTLRFYEILKSQVLEYDLGNEAILRLERTFLMKVRIAVRLAVISDLSRKEKRRIVRGILSHPVVQSVLNKYPIGALEKTTYLLTRQMKKRNVLGVCSLIKLRELARSKGLLQILLNQIRPRSMRY